MSKHKRAKASTNGHDPNRQIDSAIDASQARPGAHAVTIEVADQPVRLAPAGKLRLDTPRDPNQTMLLVLDAAPNVWRAVLLPPGAKWLLAADTGPRAALWTPGKPR